MPPIFRLLIHFSLALVLAAATTAWADPPGRVGRLALIEGNVAMRTVDMPDWQDARINWPITSGAVLHTGGGDRAEIRIGSGVLRMGGSTEIHILRLDDQQIRVWLEYGNLAVRVRSSDPDARFVIETRDGRALTAEPGRYRADYAHATTTLATEVGRLEFESHDGRTTVPEGRSVEIWVAGGTQFRWGYPVRDEFSDWVQARDDRDDALDLPRYVSPEMTGAEDLTHYGDWGHYADHGPVWYPRHVPQDWAPYRAGSWVWMNPWGWTWVDDTPWGFAPFHYGRWTHIHGRWAWVPGAYVARPVYAPALVAWIGSPGWSVSFSSGHSPAVGWFPLGPGEVFIPGFHASPVFVRKVNITHVTSVTHITRIVKEPHRARYKYRDHRHALTVVPADTVRHGRPVRERRLRDPERWVRSAGIAAAPAVTAGRRVADRGTRERSAGLDEQRRRRFSDDQARRVDRSRSLAQQTAEALRRDAGDGVERRSGPRPQRESPRLIEENRLQVEQLRRRFDDDRRRARATDQRQQREASGRAEQNRLEAERQRRPQLEDEDRRVREADRRRQREASGRAEQNRLQVERQRRQQLEDERRRAQESDRHRQRQAQGLAEQVRLRAERERFERQRAQQSPATLSSPQRLRERPRRSDAAEFAPNRQSGPARHRVIEPTRSQPAVAPTQRRTAERAVGERGSWQRGAQESRRSQSGHTQQNTWGESESDGSADRSRPRSRREGARRGGS